MKVSIDPERCAGHGACVATCPDVFEIGDDGYARVTAREIPAELAALAEQSARQCPERAITVDTGG